MASGLELIDPFNESQKRACPVDLHLNSIERSPILALYRLLSGTADIRVDRNGIFKTYKPRSNYFNITYVDGVRLSPKNLKVGANVDDLELISSSLSRISNKNRAFYLHLTYEMVHAILALQLKDHLRAFLHCYRAIERMSFAFPLIYALNSDVLKGAYAQLKDFFVKGEELGLLRNMVDEIVKEQAWLDVSVTIDMLGDEATRKSSYRTYMKSLGNDLICEASDNDYLKVKFFNLGSCVISLRNRLFHNLSGDRRNFNMNELKDLDDFLQPINKLGINWIASIFAIVLSKEF